MIAMLVASALLAPQTAPANANIGPSPEMQAAVAAYIRCLTLSPIAECAAQRSESAAAIDRGLEAMGGHDAASRHDTVEKLLAKLDQLAPQLHASLPPGATAVNTITSSRMSPAAIGGPVDRYAGCVTEKFNRALNGAKDLRTGDQARALFAGAKAQCDDVRAAATREAEAILSKTEHDPALRAKIIAESLELGGRAGRRLCRFVGSSFGQGGGNAAMSWPIGISFEGSVG